MAFFVFLKKQGGYATAHELDSSNTYFYSAVTSLFEAAILSIGKLRLP